MKDIKGISISVGSYERGLWFDHDKKNYPAAGIGAKFDLAIGRWIRPIPKFWKKAFWKGDMNPWKTTHNWFVLRTPMLPAFFISIAVMQYGFYVGCKSFHIGDGDETWADKNMMDTYALCPTITFRKTRWK